jgi:hypothetical protein
MLTATMPNLHVRFAGRSEDLELATLELRPSCGDTELRAALARRYQVAPEAFDEYVVVREQGVIIVRPVAYYG